MDGMWTNVYLPVVTEINTLKVMVVHTCTTDGLFRDMNTWLYATASHVNTEILVDVGQLGSFAEFVYLSSFLPAAYWGFIDYTAQIEETVQVDEESCARANC
jgi:hypothetical protein